MDEHDVPAELAGRWRRSVVLKRDVFSIVERGTFRGPDGARLRGPAKTQAKKRALTARALDDLAGWIGSGRMAAAE